MTRIDRFPSTSPLDMFTVEEMNALDRGAVAAYRKDRNLNRYITPLAVLRPSAPRHPQLGSRRRGPLRVYEYAFTHRRRSAGWSRGRSRPT